MRIIAGQWRSRRLSAPRGTDTRPTTDRVREALFQHLMLVRVPDVQQRRVLDLYAGSGALCLEALSRGAPYALAVEHDRRALTALRSNIESLGATADVLARPLPRALGRITQAPFGLIFADPPYRIVLDQSFASDLRALATDDAVWVYEHAREHTADLGPAWQIVDRRVYGGTAVSIASAASLAE